MISPECIWPVGAELGEGPVWSRSDKAVYFVDIKSKQIHRYATETRETMTWPAPSEPGFIVPASDEAFVCGLRKGLYRFDARAGTFDKLADVEREQAANRLNDGFVDPQGYLWFGSMDDAEDAPTGALYRVDEHGKVERRDDGYIITNGPAMSPDRRTLYHTDTLGRTIYAFDVDDEHGALSNKRAIIHVQGTAHPDGMAVDAQGCLWVALFGGGCIERYSPEGQQIDTVAFPCSNITKLVFGGDDLRTAYVTTALKGLSESRRERETLGGGLFAFRSPVPGLPQNVLTRGLVRAH